MVANVVGEFHKLLLLGFLLHHNRSHRMVAKRENTLGGSLVRRNKRITVDAGGQRSAQTDWTEANRTLNNNLATTKTCIRPPVSTQHLQLIYYLKI